VQPTASTIGGKDDQSDEEFEREKAKCSALAEDGVGPWGPPSDGRVTRRLSRDDWI